MDLALSGDRIDLAGIGYTSADLYVAQLTATGQLDPSFGVGGVVKGVQCNDLALAAQSDGKVVVALREFTPFSLHVTRLLANGSPDTTFGTGGAVTVPDPAPAWDTPFAMKLDPLGRFVIGGWQQTTTDNITKFMVMRLTSAGTLDSSFGVGGIGTSGNLVNLNYIYGEVGMALQPDGKMVLVSTAYAGGNIFAAARFDGDSALLAASLPQHASSVSLNSAQAQPLLAEAEARWRAAGVDTSMLGAIDVRIADLGGTILGLADEVHHAIWLDDNAAGWGWFVDKTPWDNSEFITPGARVPSDHMDLLTVLEHEVGHLLGFEHATTGVMQETLAAGVRELPNGLEPALWSSEGNEWIVALLSLEQKSKDHPI
jgi:uncharacterized delta-60 repeat protein